MPQGEWKKIQMLPYKMKNKKGGSTFYLILIVLAVLFLVFSIPQFNIFKKAVGETKSCLKEDCATSCRVKGTSLQHEACREHMKEKDDADKYLCCLQK
jgi:hypothetical protein